MENPIYLAMTAAEYQANSETAAPIAWMACHFSSYATGLTNLPRQLPPNSILILNDRTPIRGHDPELICEILDSVYKSQRCSGVLLDFQRPPNEESMKLLLALRSTQLPLCISATHAQGEDDCIFLPPVPLLQTPKSYLAPYQGRQIWLEMAMDGLCVCVTEQGSTITPLPAADTYDLLHTDADLHCHYRVDLQPGCATFRLQRTRNDLLALQQEAIQLGVSRFVGLWQELGKW